MSFMRALGNLIRGPPKSGYLADVKGIEKDIFRVKNELMGATSFRFLRALGGLDDRIKELVVEEGNLLEELATVISGGAQEHLAHRSNLLEYYDGVGEDLAESLEKLDALKTMDRGKHVKIAYDAIINREMVENSSLLLAANIRLSEIVAKENEMNGMVHRLKGFLNDTDMLIMLFTKHGVLLHHLGAHFHATAQHFQQVMKPFVYLADTYQSYGHIKNIITFVRQSSVEFGNHVQQSVGMISDSSLLLAEPPFTLKRLEFLPPPDLRMMKELPAGQNQGNNGQNGRKVYKWRHSSGLYD